MKSTSPELERALQEYGLSEAEVRVYLAGLAVGARPASIIAEKAELKRGHTYNMLTSLMEKGLVQEFEKNGTRHFTCSSPATFVANLEDRARHLSTLTDLVRVVLPELDNIKNPRGSSPKVRFFQGNEGIKGVLEKVLHTEEKIIYGVFDLDHNWTMADGKIYEWVERFLKRRVEKEIWYYGIVNRVDPDDYMVREQKSQLRKLKVAEGIQIPAEIMIAGERVVFISAAHEKIGIVVESPDIAQTLCSIHRSLWNFLPAC